MNLQQLLVREFVGYVQVPVHVGFRNTIIKRKSSAIMLMDGGTVEYYHQGKTYISDEKHVLLIPQGLEYSLCCTAAGASPQINFQAVVPFPEIVSFEIQDPSTLLRLCKSIETLWTFQRENAMLRIMRCIYDLLSQVYDTHTNHYSPECRLIAPSIAYLEKHFTDPALNNDLLARKSLVSTVYFRKLFKRRFGVSPMKYVREKRIERAQELLQTRQLSVTAIANLTGFNSVYHFSCAFRSETGLSPSQWQKRNAQ